MVAFIVFGFFLSLGVLIYFFIMPLLIPTYQIFMVNLSDDVDKWSRYFSSINSIVSSITALVAIVIGYLYYYNRKKFEIALLNNGRLRNHLDYILNELSTYDDYILKILLLNIKDQKELEVTRYKIERSFDNILILFEDPQLLGFSSIEINNIFKVNSYVDNNLILKELTLEQIKTQQDKLSNIMDEYKEYLRIAKTTCVTKREDIHKN